MTDSTLPESWLDEKPRRNVVATVVCEAFVSCNCNPAVLCVCLFSFNKRLRSFCQDVWVQVRTVSTHGDVLNVHTEAFLKPHTGGRGSSSVLLTKICPRPVITCFRGSPKKLLDLSHCQV